LVLPTESFRILASTYGSKNGILRSGGQ
jgi:hypothetical protein